tara:strand:- start:315 stop:542 length:228 start_codon:yes stop_codon:yes gene_type:complete
MTTTKYTGFNSPASNAIRKATLLAEANKALKFADFINSWSPYPNEDEEAFEAQCARWQRESYAEAEELRREAEAI